MFGLNQTLPTNKIVKTFIKCRAVDSNETHHYAYEVSSKALIDALESLGKALEVHAGTPITEWRQKFGTRRRAVLVEIIHERYLSVSVDGVWITYKPDYQEILRKRLFERF